MTDYNDGKWHGWNGGECPVHRESKIWYASTHNGEAGPIIAGKLDWGNKPLHNYQIIAFRVVESHREPREFWLRISKCGEACGTDKAVGNPPSNWGSCGETVIKVREVLE